MGFAPHTLDAVAGYSTEGLMGVTSTELPTRVPKATSTVQSTSPEKIWMVHKKPAVCAVDSIQPIYVHTVHGLPAMAGVLLYRLLPSPTSNRFFTPSK